MKATEKQINFLMKLDPQLNIEELKELEIKEASKMIGRLLKQSKANGTSETRAKTTTKVVKTAGTAKASVFDDKVLNEYLTLMSNGSRMDDYYKKSTFGAIKFTDGRILPFSKPHIETSFCFGYGCYGQSSIEDEKLAGEQEDYARTNENYFIEENMKGINENIEAFNKCLTDCSEGVAIARNYQHDEIVYFSFIRKLNDDGKVYDHWYHDITYQVIRVLTADEIKLCLKAYEELKEAFQKRLDTYLKRYGLSKLHTWTFLRD